MIPALHELLEYKNEEVFARYKKDYPNNKMSPEAAFSELVKYIWLCMKHDQDKKCCKDQALDFACVMHEEMAEIDDMWHVFLLFTKDYQDFCQKYLSAFFHHQPMSSQSKIDLELNYEIELRRYLAYIEQHLGPDTLKKWFQV